MTLNLDIAPVAFDQVTADWLPGRNPYEYQWQAYQLIQSAFANNETLCLFLVTPTGSGKTLASYAYSIQTGIPALGVYPTNELIRDQEKSLAPEYQRVLNRENWVLRIDSRTLDEWGLDLEESRHASTLEVLLNWPYPILTNPDILFYILFGRYPDISGQRQRLFSLIGNTYRLMVFDEFHLYNIKQMADVAFVVGALQAINPNKSRVYVFASATPELAIVPWLRDRLGIRVEIVTAAPSNDKQARFIAQPVKLTVLPADLGRWQGPQTLIDNLFLLDEFLVQYPQARAVTILEAVVGAINVARVFRDRYPGKSVGEVHGLSSDAQRENALQQAITVGTSTIEVGIDFKNETGKDVLVFEAHTSSKFMQRFGRLARHTKDIAVPNWTLALVPPYVYHFLCNCIPDKAAITRQELASLIEEAYEKPEDFATYLRKHAPAEFHAAKYFVQSLFQSDDKPEIIRKLDQVILNLTGKNAYEVAGKFRQYKDEGIVEPLMAFRGSNFQAAIWDQRGVDAGFPAKRYNLMFLLRRGDFEELDTEEYESKLNSLEELWPGPVDRERRYSATIKRDPNQLLGVYGYFTLSRLLDEGRKVWFEADGEEVYNRKAQVTVITGLRIVTEPHMRLKRLNKLLERKYIVAWFLDRHPATIKLGRSLPHLFELYELKIRQPGGALSGSWSIAFNQDAFFLDSLNWCFAQKASEAIII